MKKMKNWEEITSQLLKGFEGKTLEEQASLLKKLCYSSYVEGYEHGLEDCGIFFYKEEEY